jgi:hypothetical protein
MVRMDTRKPPIAVETIEEWVARTKATTERTPPDLLARMQSEAEVAAEAFADRMHALRKQTDQVDTPLSRRMQSEFEAGARDPKLPDFWKSAAARFPDAAREIEEITACNNAKWAAERAAARAKAK